MSTTSKEHLPNVPCVEMRL